LHEVTATRPALALLAAVAAASLLAADASSTAPVKRIVNVIVTGKGTVTSAPRGVSCPRTCRALFPKDSLVHLKAKPAAGWKVVSWAGDCKSKTAKCSFYLTTNHECSSQVCKVGAFGVRVLFARSSFKP
jgi:hypothetical protein